MQYHIFGACGAFMAGLATIMKQAQSGDMVGYDRQFLPPMSEQLKAIELSCEEGYESWTGADLPDQIIVGNTIGRGNPALERALAAKVPMTSGPEWLYQHVLQHRPVIAVGGTHGKTTTTGLISWVLDQAGQHPGFLVGGRTGNFASSAQLGDPNGWFVIEGDEYGTAYYDARPKLMHYRPNVLILNNIEMDHYDIYRDIQDVEKAFYEVVKSLPAHATVIAPQMGDSVNRVLAGVDWCNIERFGLDASEGDQATASTTQAGWTVRAQSDDWHRFDICCDGDPQATIDWELIGSYNAMNCLAAMLACRCAGVALDVFAEACSRFKGVARRMDRVATHNATGIQVWDDFAHHPTAVDYVVAATQQKHPQSRVVLVVKPSNYSQRTGKMVEELAVAMSRADVVMFVKPEGDAFPLEKLTSCMTVPCMIVDDLSQASADKLAAYLQDKDQVVMCSSRHFEGFEQCLMQALEQRAAAAAK